VIQSTHLKLNTDEVRESGRKPAMCLKRAKDKIDTDY